MSDRDSTLRLNLAAAGMLTMLKQLEKQAGELTKNIEGVGNESKKSEVKINPFLNSAKKGLGAAKSAAVDLGGELKKAVTTAVTLGGALSLGGGIRAANIAVNQYHDLAFAIRTATGEAYSYEQVQKDVEKIGDKWSQSNEKVAKSYDEIFRQTKDVAFAKKAT